jgi:hypothetical protein
MTTSSRGRRYDRSIFGENMPRRNARHRSIPLRGAGAAWTVLLSGLISACLATASHGQSIDAQKPTPLGPGVNRANIDNSVPGHFYVFYVGPGHVDIDMAFHEMGIFGNPFHQLLNFDFYNPDGTLASHTTVVSQGNLARNHTDGDIATRQKLLLAVTTQKGAIRLGGYYELEIKGAVSFDGPTVGTGVTPQPSERLVK